MMQNQKDYSCGLGKWRPQCLQKFATMKYFTVVYGLLGTIQAMSFVYFVATLTTLEKRFQIKSETTGILMSGNEMSQIFLATFLAYKGGKGNRPVWIAWGVLFSSLSCFILALPHFMYGPGSNALALTEEYFDSKFINSSSQRSNDFILCDFGQRENFQECKEKPYQKPIFSLSLIFISQFVLGVGTTLYVTLGQPYLDDNTKIKNTPKLLGITMALRSAGPAGGFVLGFFCLNFYIDPSLTPIIERSDPRWLGAWWLGWLILGTAMTIFSFLIASFPKQLKPKLPVLNTQTKNNYMYEMVPANAISKEQNFNYASESLKNSNLNNNEEGIFTDFKKALKRVCFNPLLIFNNFTAVFYILGASGYINFYTKYAEVQYHQSAAFSSMIAGVSTVISIIFGFLVSGMVISKYKPKESYLLLFNIFIAVVYMVGEMSFLFLGCDGNAKNLFNDDRGVIYNSPCNAKCSCNLTSYAPVCFEKENISFFSPCHAGCSHIEDVVKKTFSNCSCLPTLTDVVRQGPCKVNCLSMFIIFVVIQSLIQMIGCSGRITNVLINYRSVEPRDKPLAQGICLFMISLLAFIPGPIIYGKVIDNSCVIWESKCGYKGNCWVYDKNKFRTYLNTTALCFTFGAFICDIVVFFLGKNIKLYEENSREANT